MFTQKRRVFRDFVSPNFVYFMKVGFLHAALCVSFLPDIQLINIGFRQYASANRVVAIGQSRVCPIAASLPMHEIEAS